MKRGACWPALCFRVVVFVCLSFSYSLDEPNMSVFKTLRWPQGPDRIRTATASNSKSILNLTQPQTHKCTPGRCPYDSLQCEIRPTTVRGIGTLQ